MPRPLSVALGAVAALALAGAAHAQPGPRGETTRAEVEQRTADRFARMDANGDGVLDQADREAVRRQAFDRIDADKDGAISFAEFDARRGQRGEARAERPDAARHGFARRGGRSGPHTARAVDADSDGTVTASEFTAAALARFDRADANGDGTISSDERRDARRDWRRDRRRGPPARDAG